jgi:hypothetical protein
VSRSLAATWPAPRVVLAGTAGTGPWSVFGATVAGAGEMFTQTHPTVWQSTGGAGAFGQHGCAGGLATDMEAHAPIGFKRRKATARIAKPNFVVAFMVPLANLQCTLPTTSLTP